MTSMKTLKEKSTERLLSKKIVEGENVSFGPPPMEYRYRCSHCQHKMMVNEAIIADIPHLSKKGFLIC